MAGYIGEHAERAADENGRHDREAVQPVGKIHGVRGADDDEEGEHDEAERAERIRDELEEGHDELVERRHALRQPREIAGGGKADDRLP